LRAAELARVLAAAPAARKQHAVDLADEVIGERKASPQARDPVLESRDVVRDLDHVIERHARRFVQLKEQQVRERGLRPFDLGGEDRLLAHVGVEEERLVGQQCRDAVESTEREHRRFEGLLERSVHDERWDRRQRCRHKGPHLLAPDARDLVSARLSPLHSAPPSCSPILNKRYRY